MSEHENLPQFDLPKSKALVEMSLYGNEGVFRVELTEALMKANAEIDRLRKGLQMIAYGATETSRGKGMWDMTNVSRVAESVLNGRSLRMDRADVRCADCERMFGPAHVVSVPILFLIEWHHFWHTVTEPYRSLYASLRKH